MHAVGRGVVGERTVYGKRLKAVDEIDLLLAAHALNALVEHLNAVVIEHFLARGRLCADRQDAYDVNLRLGVSFAQEIDNVAVVFDEFIEIVPAQLVYADNDKDLDLFHIIAQRVEKFNAAGLFFEIYLAENIRTEQAELREVRGVLKIGIVHDAFHA